MDFLDILEKMQTISIDLETTGIKETDQIWSGAFHNNKGSSNSSFFSINKTPRTGTIKDLERFLEEQHSSSSFGASQAGKGVTVDGKATVNVLGEWAEAIFGGKETSLNTFVKELTDELGRTNEGSVLLLQNVNFEDRLLSKAYGTGSLESFKPFTELLVEKGLPASTDPRFGEPFDRHLLHRNIYDKRQERAVAQRSLFSNKTSESVSKYFEASMGVVDEHLKNIEMANKHGKVAVVDLMDFTRAVYAHGLKEGQLPSELLSFGAKVDTLARALLGEDEIHSALSDSIQQEKLFKIMSEEVSNIKRHGTGYKSEVVEKLVTQMKKDRTYSRQLRERSLNVIRESLEKGASSGEEVIEALDSRFYRSNRHLGGVYREGFLLDDFYKELKNKVLEGYTEGFESKDSLLKTLEEFSEKYKTQKKDVVSNSLRKGVSLLNNNYTKAAAGILATGAVLSMFKEPPEREEKSQAYRELYDNQYFGTAFADWNTRNNSHVMR